MALYKVVVVNEDGQPQKGVTVAAYDLATFPAISDRQVTSEAGEVQFSVSGPHFFDAFDRRGVSFRDRSYEGKIQIQIVALAGFACYDYVVDCHGFGTHETVREMMADFIAAAEADTDVMRTCWLCCSEDEDTNIPISSTSISVGSSTLTIEAASAPRSPFEPTHITERAALVGIIGTTDDAYFKTATSGVRYVPHLNFKNIRMTNRTSVGTTPSVTHAFIYNAASAGHSGFDFFDCHFDIGATSNSNGIVVRAAAASVGDPAQVRFYRCNGTAGDLFQGAAASSGTLEIYDCELSLRHLMQNDDDFGLTLLRIVGGTIDVASYFYNRTNGGNIDVYLENVRLNNNGATTGFRMATISATGAMRFMAFDVQYVQTSTDVAVRFATLSSNTSNAVVDSVFIDGLYARMSGSSSNAGTMLSIATFNHVHLGYIVAQAWTTVVSGGTPLTSDHGGLAGLADDDHSLYLLASDATSRAAFATNWTDLTDGGATVLHSHASGGGGSGGGGLLTMLADAVGNIWTDMPAAKTELFGNTDHRTKVDLTNASEVRLVVEVNTAGPAGSELRLEYSTDESTWQALDAGTGPTVAIDVTGVEVSSTVLLDAGAQADVFLRVVGVDGDAATDPEFGLIVAQFDTVGVSLTTHEATGHDPPMIDFCLVTTDSNATETIDVNSTSYVALDALQMRVDFSVVEYTHFRIWGRLATSDGATDVTLQLATYAAPTTPLSAGGDDYVITAGGENTNSGWIALATPPTTDQHLVLAVKGASATVDLLHRGLHVSFKKE